MKYRFWRYEHLRRGQNVIIGMSGTEANVFLVDPINYERYRRGHSFTYFGGHYTSAPARLSIPHDGTWILVADLGGAAGSTTFNVQVA